jgi:hypothetical protein
MAGGPPGAPCCMLRRAAQPADLGLPPDDGSYRKTLDCPIGKRENRRKTKKRCQEPIMDSWLGTRYYGEAWDDRIEPLRGGMFTTC